MAGTAGFIVLGDVTGESRLSETATALVAETEIGTDADVDVQWTDREGQEWVTRLTPRDPDQVAVGDQVRPRYDPDRPDDRPHPADTDAFELPGQGRVAFNLLLVSTGVLLALFWTWRLGRWATGAVRSGQPVLVEVVVAHFESRQGWPGHAGLWLRFRTPDGRVWHQRPMWSRRLVSLALAGPGAEGRARPCLGLRRMYLVEVPGFGTFLPTSTARSHAPWYYQVRLLPGFVQRDLGLGTRAVLALVLLAFMFLAVGPWAVPYAVIVGLAGWLWMGATPFRGVRG